MKATQAIRLTACAIHHLNFAHLKVLQKYCNRTFSLTPNWIVGCKFSTLSLETSFQVILFIVQQPHITNKQAGNPSELPGLEEDV